VVEGGTRGGGKTGVKTKLKRTQPLTVKKRERESKKTQWSKKHATVFLSVGEHVPESVAEPTVTPVTGVGDGGGVGGRAGELCRCCFFWPESSQGSVSSPRLASCGQNLIRDFAIRDR